MSGKLFDEAATTTLIEDACQFTPVTRTDALMIFRRSRQPRQAGIRDAASKASGASALEMVIDHLPVAAIVLDRAGRPSVINEPARTLFGLDAGAMPRRFPTREVTEVAAEAIQDATATRRVDVWYPSRLTLDVQASALEGNSEVLVIVQDVTEEERIQQARKDLVAHASHELKSPVASLRALAEVVISSVREDPDAAERFAGKIVEETSRLGALLTDLLDLSRLEQARGTAPSEPCDLGSIIEDEIAALHGYAHECGVHLDVELAKEAEVLGDKQQLGIMVRNLIDNAIRYTPDDGKVEVRLEHTDERVEVTVTDTGAGIPQDAQARIFERFYRVDQARTRERGGTGLGLAIVKHAAELHRGAVTVESELGRGSTFTVSLPSAPRSGGARSPAGTD